MSEAIDHGKVIRETQVYTPNLVTQDARPAAVKRTTRVRKQRSVAFSELVTLIVGSVALWGYAIYDKSESRWQSRTNGGGHLEILINDDIV
jgi:hypothetical protein